MKSCEWVNNNKNNNNNNDNNVLNKFGLTFVNSPKYSQ